jgi:hypothetical protein
LSRSRLETLEAAGLDPRSHELLVVLAWLVAGDVPVDDAELKAGLRRAVLVLAAGGDPHREVDLDTVAATRLAEELDTPDRRAALDRALVGLETDATGLPAVSEGLSILHAEPDLAWRIFALALLADELSDE